MLAEEQCKQQAAPRAQHVTTDPHVMQLGRSHAPGRGRQKTLTCVVQPCSGNKQHKEATQQL